MIKWWAPRQQFVQQNPQRIDVASRVDIQLVQFRLLRAHVLGRSNYIPKPRIHRLFGQSLPRRLGHAEVDDFWHGLAIVERHQHIRRFQIAMNDPLLMGVLHRLADLHEQLQPIPRRQAMLVAIPGDRHPLHQLHHKIRPADIRHSSVKDFRDIRMVH